ncbi:MAG: putative coiled-coil protein SlyX [Flavobacteriales bacterium]
MVGAWLALTRLYQADAVQSTSSTEQNNCNKHFDPLPKFLALNTSLPYAICVSITRERMMNSNPIEPRIIDLENRITFMEDYINKLNDRVASQDEELLAMTIQMRHLHQRVEGAGEGSSGPDINPAQEIPPHY